MSERTSAATPGRGPTPLIGLGDRLAVPSGSVTLVQADEPIPIVEVQSFGGSSPFVLTGVRAVVCVTRIRRQSEFQDDWG